MQPLVPDDVDRLSEAQHAALIDLVAAIAIADGDLSDAELGWIGQRLVHGAFAGKPGTTERLGAAIGRVPPDPGARAQHVADAANRLAPGDLAERVVAALAQLGGADRIVAAERALLAVAARALGIAEDRLAAICEHSITSLTRAAIFPAIARGDVAFVRTLLDGGTPVDLRDHQAWTPLHVAMACGQAGIVALLVERGAPLDPLHAQGSSPLFCACNKPYAELVRQLIAAGANPNLRGTHGFAPLHVAAIAGQVEVARALVEGGAHDVADRDGRTAREHAAAYGRDELIAVLR